MVNSAPEPGRGGSVCIPAPRAGRRPYQTGSAGRQRRSRAGSMQFTSTRQSKVKKEATGLIRLALTAAATNYYYGVRLRILERIGSDHMLWRLAQSRYGRDAGIVRGLSSLLAFAGVSVLLQQDK